MKTYTHKVSDFTGHECDLITFEIETGRIVKIQLWSEVAALHFDATEDIMVSPFAMGKFINIVRVVRQDLKKPSMNSLEGA